MTEIWYWFETQWSEHWGAWLLFAAYIIITWVVAGLARWIARSLVFRLTARTTTTLDDRLVKAVGGPVRFLVLAIGFRLALETLGAKIPSIGAATEYSWLLKGITALVILAATGLVNALLKTGIDWYLSDLAAGNKKAWDELLPVIQRVVSLLLYFIALSIILEHFGINIAALVTTAGVASLAIALAAQETLSNMLGGFMILVDRTFKVGDVIELADGKSGEVIQISLRSTRILQFDGTALMVPNKDMANSRLVNLALPTPQAAIRQTIGVGYGTDVEQAKAILLDVMQSHPEVLANPTPGVWFTKFGPSSLDLFTSCWVASYRDRFRVTDELNTRILAAFRAANIDIPYPQITVSYADKS